MHDRTQRQGWWFPMFLGMSNAATAQIVVLETLIVRTPDGRTRVVHVVPGRIFALDSDGECTVSIDPSSDLTRGGMIFRLSPHQARLEVRRIANVTVAVTLKHGALATVNGHHHLSPDHIVVVAVKFGHDAPWCDNYGSLATPDGLPIAPFVDA